ncbi:PilZ domain-containing protein [Methylocystis sp. IM3]|uniref:PilZ domain-containing protein n=2 Tax=Methylocystis TaxID=133 RepID=UPI00311968BA
MASTMHISLSPAAGHMETGDPARVPLSLTGRYLLVGSVHEYDCRTHEISADAVSLFAPVVSTPGEKVVLYLDELGRLTGSISRVTQIGFDMRLELTARRREKLESQLAWRAGSETPAARQREHLTPENGVAILRRGNGREHFVRIRSLSVSDVALETDQRVLLGEEVLVGATPAKVVRVQDGQVACEFLRPFEQIDQSTRL